MRILATTLVIVLLPNLVAAQETQEGELTNIVRQHDATARYHFEAERYGDALVALLAAQQLLPAVPRLYSIATCYDQLGQAAHAIAYYDRFVVEAAARGFNTAGRDQLATTHIRVLNERLTDEAAERQTEPVIIPQPARRLSLVMPSRHPNRTTLYLRYAFTALAIVSATMAATASGIIIGVGTMSDVNPDTYTGGVRRTMRDISYATFGIAGGTAIIATVLYLVYHFRRDSTSIWLSHAYSIGGLL